MNYENLKDAIVAVIKQNGNEEITGNILQQVLVAMVNSLGSGYQFMGVAGAATNPGTIDQKAFYLSGAVGEMVLPNFGITIDNEICALIYDSSWTKLNIISIDDSPIADSPNLISSAAIYTALDSLSNSFMQLVRAAIENHLAIFDGDGQVKDAGIGVDDLALPASHYPDLFAGFAGNLVDTRSAGTRQSFAFRQSGGDGVNYLKRIKGKTFAWNQSATLRDNMQEVATTDQTPISSGVFGGPAYPTHKYLFVARITTLMASDSVWFWGGSKYAHNIGVLADEQKWWIMSPATQQNQTSFIVVANRGGNGTTGTAGYKDLQCFDLTLMFGTGNEPTTYAEFEALYYLNYYAPASRLINNTAEALETTGFNAYDPASGKAQIIKGQQYQITGTYTSLSFDGEAVAPDGSGVFTAPGTGELSVVGGNSSDTCVHLVGDGSRNGEYEPYWKRTPPLGLTSITGIPEGGTEADRVTIFPDGMRGVGSAFDAIYEEGGEVKAAVVMGERSYQVGDENDATVRTDMTNTCYPLATPVIYTDLQNADGTPFQFPKMVEVDELGTERRLPDDTADNPQAPFECDSNYSISTANLVRKLSQ